MFWLSSLVDCLKERAWVWMWWNEQSSSTVGFLEFKGKNLSHFPYSLCPSFSEENPGSHFDKLRILDKSKYRHGLTTPTYYLFLLPEHDAGLVAALHPLDWVYPLYDGCLPDVAYMHCGSEPSQYLCRVEEDANISLEILASHRLFPLRAGGHHATSQLSQGDVQGKGSTLLGSD